MTIAIPNYATFELTDIVCDYNGTIASDGKVLPEIKSLFHALQAHFTLHVITADTFGSVQKELEGYGAKIKVLQSSDHTQEKADFIQSLGAANCAALGNGNNDAMMLKTAALGIAVIGSEGCSMQSMHAADIVTTNSMDALKLFTDTKRLIATLRK